MKNGCGGGECENDGEYPGNCSAEERDQLTKIINKCLRHRQVLNDRQNPYWYPLSVPTYNGDEILNALDSLMRMETSMGRKVRDFEAKFANWVGAKHAVMVNSGSTADLLACFACVSPEINLLNAGDEVLVPALTWPTQIWSACMAGLTVKLIDVDPDTLNTTPEIIEGAIGEKTKALFLVHLMGNPCDMNSIMQICYKHNLVLLEDCCESLGTRYAQKHVGTFGLAGAFSFFFSHHLVTMEGGMVITNNDKIADTLRVLRAHGWCREMHNKPATKAGRDERYQFVNWGFNVRPTELQGAFGQIQLARLHDFCISRNKRFNRFLEYIKTVPQLHLPKCSKDSQPCWMFLPITVKPNDKFTKLQLIEHLEKNGVETRPVVVGDLKRQPVAIHFDFLRSGHQPGTEYVDDNAFIVGLHPQLHGANNQVDDTIDRLQAIIHNFLTQKT